MKTIAVRLYGKNDLRLEEFELPPVKNDEILARIVTDSICMSTYKAVIQGKTHRRVPDDVDKNPVIIGHEFCGEIIEVGSALRDKYHPGMKFTVQTALNRKDDPNAAPGYSYRYIGGSATHVIIPREVMELGCLLEYKGDAYFYGSLAEPMSCIIGAFHAVYHTEAGKYVHEMGIKPGGNMAILAGVGPMGLGAIDYAIHAERKPSRLVVTDIDKARLKRASRLYTAEEAKKNGIELVYVDASAVEDPVGALLNITGGEGYDDVFVFAPVKSVIEQGDKILRKDGCLNFFAGPVDPAFTAGVNFYNVHYNLTHIMGTTGGNTDDMAEALEMMADGRINPSSMITHIGGLDSVIETIMNLPEIPGGKKLIYNNISMELTALDELREKADQNPLFLRLAEIVEANNGLWCGEAEKYLLENAKPIAL
ncbi:MAG TPA: L-sorbose 1-phosphate reductase [Ruminiclostridium sp.]|jgi:threonine dehydrogenase-like Zn-dependent dehydrogenase|nr:zinc-binding dehydrogenase [Clostridiaceae bacterium]HAA25325.1 L-sorbose 1-phosphate reductase [Ruminiclostridium sp.]